MRKLVRRTRWVFPTVVIVGLLAGALYFYIYGLTPGPVREGRTTPEYVDVPAGAALSQVAEQLREVDLIRSPRLFVFLGRFQGVDRHIKAGEYAIRPGTPPLRILALLEKGMSDLDQVTVPEGLTTREIAVLLSKRAGVDTATFLKLTRDPAFAERLDVPAGRLEGYLFPDTYAVLPGSRPEDILRLMVSHGARVFREEMGHAQAPPTYTPHEILTMASIVESEARLPAERARIAGVYYNRLKQGMKLQADPTVAYALGGRPERIFFKDLKVASPYNTYAHFGLPPGPICNPGRAAIRASLNPDTHAGELFFVSRGDGTHSFSRTFDEHDRAIARIRSAPRPADSTVARREPARGRT